MYVTTPHLSIPRANLTLARIADSLHQAIAPASDITTSPSIIYYKNAK